MRKYLAWIITPKGKLLSWGLSGMAMDEDRWVTIRHGKDKNKGKGVHFYINDETGTVLSGQYAGVKLNDLDKASKEMDARATARHIRQETARVNTPPKTIDLKNPKKLDAKNVLQNRNRSSAASVMQMQSIAKHPDYSRLGCTQDFGSGAPVVAYGYISKNQKGKITEAIMPDGSRYTVQYAVIDAEKVLPSNDAYGNTNEKYFSDDSNITRAIAGNGRIAGLIEAYKQGNADAYTDALASDLQHGISEKVINRMKNPVLVRIMQPKDVSADIGDKSNRQSGLTLSPVEQANTDTGRVDLSKLETYEDGSPTINSIKDFVARMPANEQGALLDEDGHPSKKAADRLEAAVFAAAYKNDALTRLHVQALEPEAKNFLKGLSGAAAKVASLQNLGKDYDVRGIISHATLRAVNAIRSGQKLEDIVGQREMWKSKDDDEAERTVLQMLVANRRSPKSISDKLQKMVKYLTNEAESQSGSLFGGSLFGEEMATPRNEIITAALAQDSKEGMGMKYIAIWTLSPAGTYKTAWAVSSGMAMDEDRWITVKPNGVQNKGRPALIDAETGVVKAGMGGKFNGQNIDTVHKSSRPITEEQYQNWAKRQTEKKIPTQKNNNTSAAPEGYAEREARRQSIAQAKYDRQVKAAERRLEEAENKSEALRHSFEGLRQGAEFGQPIVQNSQGKVIRKKLDKILNEAAENAQAKESAQKNLDYIKSQQPQNYKVFSGSRTAVQDLEDRIYKKTKLKEDAKRALKDFEGAKTTDAAMAVFKSMPEEVADELSLEYKDPKFGYWCYFRDGEDVSPDATEFRASMGNRLTTAIREDKKRLERLKARQVTGASTTAFKTTYGGVKCSVEITKLASGKDAVLLRTSSRPSVEARYKLKREASATWDGEQKAWVISVAKGSDPVKVAKRFFKPDDED